MRDLLFVLLLPVFSGALIAQMPTVQDVVPSIGSSAGGAAISIAGLDFTGATAVTFGSTPATNVVVVNSVLITCTLPPGIGNTQVDVSVTANSQTGTLPGGFTYLTRRLTVGDIWVIGFRGDDPDGFAFVPWVPLLADEFFAFTDKSFDGGTGEFTQAEDMLVWKAPTTGLTAGTVVVVSCPAAGTPTANVGSIVWGITDGMSNDGDQMFVVQGDLAPSGLIFGITAAATNPGAGWITSGAMDNNNSYLPSTLNVPGGNLDISSGGNEDNVDYFGARTGLDAAGYKALISVVGSTTDWRRDNSGGSFGPLDATPFVLPLGPNQPPVNSLPGAQTMDEDVVLAFNGAKLISINDPDAGGGAISVSLTVNDGVLQLGQTAGITFSSGANNSAAMSIAGTLTAINNGLNGMTLRPDANFHGTITLTMVTDDQGNTGTGGPLTDSDSLVVTVTSINDAPVIVMPAALGVDTSGSLILGSASGNAITIADADAGASPVSVTLTVTAGTLSATASGGANVTGNASGSLGITGTVVDVNATLNGMSFSAPGTTQVVTFTVMVDDQGNTGNGGARTDSKSVSISVGSVKLPLDNKGSGGSSGCVGGAGGAGIIELLLALVGGIALATVSRRRTIGSIAASRLRQLPTR